mgnify:CR=1 FL=1
MKTNILGRNTEEDQKYQDLYASVKRIAEKSEKKEEEVIKNIFSGQSSVNVQDTIRQIYSKKNDEDVSTT